MFTRTKEHGSRKASGYRKAILYALVGFVVLMCLVWMSNTLSMLDKQNELLKALDSEVTILQQQLKLKEDTLEEVTRTNVNHVLSQSGIFDKKAFPTVPSLSADKKKRILVTGGAGFVGSHLVDVLMLQGHEVTVLDNFFTGRRKNIQHWIGHPNFELEVHDVVEPFMREVDEIYHLACPASPPHYQYNPIKTIKTSTAGTLNMLGLAKRVRAKLLFTSTSEVYGDPEVHPQTEEYWGHVNPIGPRACYDEGKRVAETMCYSYMRESGVDVRVARIFNTFGPRMHPNDGRVVSNFIIQALKGEPLTIYGTGDQTRSFQYVRDLVIGLVKLMNSEYTKPVNIGNPEETTILEFAEMIKRDLSSNIPVQFLPATEDDPRQRKPDITVAETYLKWKPRFPVDLGIKKTAEYFRDELSSDVKHGKIYMDEAVLQNINEDLTI